jgi:prolyl oligopeptidase
MTSRPAATADAGGPPPTRVEAVAETIHGALVRDPYRWLEDGGDPEVVAWVAAQHTRTRAVLDGLPGRAAIAARIRESVDCGALGGSEPRGDRRFLTMRHAGRERHALFVAEAGGPPRLLVDPGLTGGDGTTSLDWWEVSPDGRLVCVGLSEAGTEAAVLHVLRTETGEWLPDRIPHCRWSAVAFEPGGDAFLYTRHPAPGTVPPGEELYHRHVWRHVLGTDPAHDRPVFGQGRDRRDFATGISISDDGRWTVVTVTRGSDRTSVFLRDGDGDFRAIFDEPHARLRAGFAGPRLLGLTNLRAPNFRLVEIDPGRPEPERWRDLVPESEHVLRQFAVTARHLAVHHLVDASARVALHRLDGAHERTLDLPPLCSVSHVGGHPSSDELLLTVQTFTRPARTVRLGGGEPDRLSPPPGFDPDRHPVSQAWCRSRDGTRVPIFLVGRAEGPGPTVLTGYGGFHIALTPTWTPAAVPFLEAGGLLAVANLRGGGEFGVRWHRDGMLDRKQNVFDDFIAAAEWLSAQGLATPARLGILGHSNGGLLVGAAMTQRPELFGAAACRVPLLDMVRYERFKIAQMWTAEYGTAADPEQFGWLAAYSPYHRVRDGVRYPPVLLTTGEQDARVDPMHARKMAARLQAADPGGLTLLRVEPRSGHGPGRPATRLVAEEADVWAFLMAALG